MEPSPALRRVPATQSVPSPPPAETGDAHYCTQRQPHACRLNWQVLKGFLCAVFVFSDGSETSSRLFQQISFNLKGEGGKELGDGDNSPLHPVSCPLFPHLWEGTGMPSPGGQLSSGIPQEYLKPSSKYSNSLYGCKLAGDWKDEAHFQENKMNNKPARLTQKA